MCVTYPKKGSDYSGVCRRDRVTAAEFAQMCDEVSDGLSLTLFPVAFFRISDLGMCAVSGRTCARSLCGNNGSKTRININTVFKRLVEVFIFGVCLLTIVRTPTAMSAPASRNGDTNELPHPKWKYPCGRTHDTSLDSDSGTGSSMESDRTIIEPVFTVAKIARDHMYGFKEEYVKKTFGAPYEEHHRMFKERGYDWLPNKKTEIPKELGEIADINDVEGPILNKFLVDIYEAMEKFAVGIEQVVWDQERTKGDFLQQFNKTEVNLRAVLCDLRIAMSNKNVSPKNNVERNIMDDQIRKLNHKSDMNVRDWIIFRDYLNGIEYLMQFLEAFLKANPPS